MPPSRFAVPAEVPGLAARRIAADILDGVLHKHRTLDDQLDGAGAPSLWLHVGVGCARALALGAARAGLRAGAQSSVLVSLRGFALDAAPLDVARTVQG